MRFGTRSQGHGRLLGFTSLLVKRLSIPSLSTNRTGRKVDCTKLRSSVASEHPSCLHLPVDKSLNYGSDGICSASKEVKPSFDATCVGSMAVSTTEVALLKTKLDDSSMEMSAGSKTHWIGAGLGSQGDVASSCSEELV